MRLAAILVAAGLLGACAHHAATPVPPPTAPEVLAAARGAVEQWRQAYEVKSLDALARLYAHDPQLVLVADGRVLVGWASIEAMLQDRLARTQKIVIRLRDFNVVSLGDGAATVTATMTRELGDAVTTVTETGALTLVLRRVGADWAIVTEHFSYRKGA